MNEALRARLAGTNINADTLLATDYLNHFNEIIMMLELVADMPEMLEDAKAWKPIGYVEHFRYSQFVERDLAIEVYALIPDARRRAFEDAVAQAHARVANGIADLSQAVTGGDGAAVRLQCGAIGKDMQSLIDRISIIIHGGEVALEQPDIDGLLNKGAAAQPNAQDDIDKLFASAPASQDDIDKMFASPAPAAAPAAPAPLSQDDIDNLFK